MAQLPSPLEELAHAGWAPQVEPKEQKPSLIYSYMTNFKGFVGVDSEKFRYYKEFWVIRTKGGFLDLYDIPPNPPYIMQNLIKRHLIAESGFMTEDLNFLEVRKSHEFFTDDSYAFNVFMSNCYYFSRKYVSYI